MVYQMIIVRVGVNIICKMIKHINKYLLNYPIVGGIFINGCPPITYNVLCMDDSEDEVRPVIELHLGGNDDYLIHYKNHFRFVYESTSEIRLVGKLFCVDILMVPHFIIK